MSFPPAARDRVMVRTSTGAGKNTEKSDGPVRHLTRRPNGLVAENRRFRGWGAMRGHGVP